MTAELPELPSAARGERIRIPRADLLISLAIILSTLAVYAAVARFGFVTLDDSFYVYDNVHLRGAFTYKTLNWVFFSFYPDYWFPLTRLSFLLDYRLFGLRAAGYHIENVVIHVLGALLLFGFLRRATHVRWPCAFVAFVFALHPLHVESVAWVAERKDVLCGFFWFATLWAWLRYTERPTWGRYAGTVVLFLLGLMSKPMIVTLPFLLFLLDLWPFRRAFSRKLIVEKIPFFALSGIVTVISALASAKTLESLSILPFWLRLENALVTVPIYVADTVWPARLWGIHAYPASIPAWQAVVAAIGIGAVSALVLGQMRERPYLAVGWFWFLGTLAPVIGFVQAGQEARADRFMYVPMVGLSVTIAWGAAEMVAYRPEWRRQTIALLATACFALAVRTSLQTGYWEDTDALFRHSIDMDSRNYLALTFLGQSHSEQPDFTTKIMGYYREATRVRPDYGPAHNLLGVALARSREYTEAIPEFEATLRIDPGNAPAHYNLGAAFLSTHRKTEAIREFQAALRIDPDFPPALNDLGVALITMPGRFTEGVDDLERAVTVDPDYALAQYDLGRALMSVPGRFYDSLTHFTEALRVNPQYAEAHVAIAVVLIRDPTQREAAIGHLRAAQAIAPSPDVQAVLDRLEKSRTPVQK